MSNIDVSRSTINVELDSITPFEFPPHPIHLSMKNLNHSTHASHIQQGQPSIVQEEQPNGIAFKRVHIDNNRILRSTVDKPRKYNPYQIPPDWNVASKHGASRRVGRDRIPQKINAEESYEVCPCCEYQIDKQPLHLMEKGLQLSFLGSGYPLFFHYMKYCIIILGVIILATGQYNLLSNYFGGRCVAKERVAANPNAYPKHVCVLDWITKLSIANKNKIVDYAEIQDILNFSTILVLMILLVLFRKEQKEIDMQCDVAELTPADYTILLKDLPIETTEKHILDFFSSEYSRRILKVAEVNLVYDISERVKKQDSIQGIVKQKKKALQNIWYSKTFNRESERWDKAIDRENTNLELLNLRIEEDPQKFSGYAFVSFETEEEKKYVLEKMSTTSLLTEIMNNVLFQSNDYRKLKFNSKTIEVGEAPEPLDIIWENLHQPSEYRNLRRLMSFSITIILLVMCSVIVYILIKFQAEKIKEFDIAHKKELSSKNTDLKLLLLEQLPSAFVSCCMVCINSVLIELIFRKVVRLESHITHTHFNINLAQKLSLTLFINTAIITCFINVFQTQNIFGKGGLIYTIFYFFVVNAGSSFISVLFDPIYYLRKILVWWNKRKGKKCNLTQEEANKLSECPPHEIEIGYVDIMKTMYITVFYSPVVPLGLIISLIGFIIYYWVQKFAVMRERIVDKQISVRLSLEMTEFLEFIISIYTASNLLFKYQTVGSLSYLQVIGFVLGLVYSFLPVQLLVDKVFFFETVNEPITYEMAYSSFVTTYALSNPITREKAKIKHRKILRDSYFTSNV